VTSDRGLQIVPTATYDDCPQLDVIMVPGGPGQQELMEDEAALGFLRKQAAGAKYVTSVCTGSLVLGAAGLLNGKRATCHGGALEHLKLLGAIPVSERVVIDGNVVTGAGVTSGIGFALRLAAILEGEETAREIQLQIEYDPARRQRRRRWLNGCKRAVASSTRRARRSPHGSARRSVPSTRARALSQGTVPGIRQLSLPQRATSVGGPSRTLALLPQCG
jgi:transcriptional regulator GlxA family with amidase domain